MNFFSPHRSRNFTPKKVLKMSPVVAQIAEERANNNVMALVVGTLVLEKIVLCLRQYVLRVVKKQPYHLNLQVTDRFTVEIASKQKEAATTKNNTKEAAERQPFLFHIKEFPK